jgi:ferredoxin-NADP reductase
VAERRVGTIRSWVDFAPELSTFNLAPEAGTSFPPYKAGQYIALTREGCRLTTRVKEADGQIRFEPAVNDDGTPKLGAVTHSYSIASAPYETKESGTIEIYVTLEKSGDGRFGRFTESLFRTPSHEGDTLGYVDRIVGNFTLDDRTAAADHVVMVGTGTGLAPFVGMVKQAAHDAKAGRHSPVKYTLIHANRTVRELGYDRTLRGLGAESTPGFDFEYVRSVSRPTVIDASDPGLCQGRANNLLRLILGLPTREEELLTEAGILGRDVASAQAAFDKSTRPRFGSGVDGASLKARMPAGGRTCVLTCGNAELMEDIRRVCDQANFRFEMEEW